MAKSLAENAASARQSLQRIKREVEALQAGDWKGKGATAFYQEMQSEVLPSLTRLAAAFETANQVTKKIGQLMLEAERLAAAIFKLGGAAASASLAAPVLSLHQKIPNASEVSTVGAIAGKIARGTPEFDALVKNDNADIVYKDEEGTGADLMMSRGMKEKLDALSIFVRAEWPDQKLRVTEAWDESDEHSGASAHYEGRAADITISDKDSAKLGRLAQLAADAGFDWVYYEDTKHVHVSVPKD
jgi:WXG100 family type VII secretion target